MKVEISGSAYAKIFLHATKYTSISVGGYILGKHKGADFEATDIVPICHGNPVGPVFDISAEMVERLYGQSTQIVGFYFANESNTSPKPAYVDKVLNGIEASTGSKAVLLQVENDALALKDKSFLKAFVSGNLVESSVAGVSISKVNGAIDSLLEAGSHLSLIDFEDHMNCTAAAAEGGEDPATIGDFRNTALSERIVKML